MGYAARAPVVLFAAALALGGCASGPSKESTAKGKPPASSGYDIRDVAKTDIDLVTETNFKSDIALLRKLAGKLYRRNPREWRGHGAASVEAAVARLFPDDGRLDFPELHDRRGTDAILYAFDEGYRGDRVLAFVVGLEGMILDAYNGKQEFYITDSLDAQKLYNSARNIEVAAWKLEHARNAAGELYLLSNATEGAVLNLSFERLFGKLIAQQDMMARIIADKQNRSITRVLQGVAQAIFLPI